MPLYLTLLPFLPFVNRFFVVVFFVYVYRKMPLSKASEIIKSFVVALLCIIPVTVLWIVLHRTVLIDDSILKNVVGHVITYMWFVCFDNGLLFRMRRQQRGNRE